MALTVKKYDLEHKVACCNDKYVWCTCGERFHYDDDSIIDHIEEENEHMY